MWAKVPRESDLSDASAREPCGAAACGRLQPPPSPTCSSQLAKAVAPGVFALPAPSARNTFPQRSAAHISAQTPPPQSEKNNLAAG